MQYKYSDIFKWSSGKPVELTNGEVPVYGSNGIVGYSDVAKYENKIILGRVGAYCGSVEYCKGKFNATDNTLITTCNETLIEYKYAYYMLKIAQLNDYAGGAAQPLITQGILKHLTCDIPDIPTQKKIASILSVYDDLIEKNNRKIAILREMAEELYKEWFVRFRFPKYKSAKFKNSSLGRIPQDFEVVKMTNVFDDYIGGGWGNEEENKQYNIPAYVIRGTDFPYVTNGKLSTCPYRWHKESNFKSRQLKPNDIIIEISGGTDEQPVGRTLLIDANTISRFGNKVICASFCKLVRVKQDKISPIYFNYWMKFLYDTKTIERFQLQSTGIINFKFDYFVRKGDVLLPPKKLMEKFDSTIYLMRENIGRLAEQNENLKTQRDLLLPRLMSGKLEVKA